MKSQIKNVKTFSMIIAVIGQLVCLSSVLAQSSQPSSSEKAAWDKIKPIAQKMMKYDEISHFSEGLAEARVGDILNGKAGFIDQSGRLVVSPKYLWVNEFSEGLVAVKLWSTGKWGAIDKTGKVIVPFKYDLVDSFRDGLARVKLNDKYGFVDKTGKIMIPVQYYGANDFSEGVSSVKAGRGWSLIDKTGKELNALTTDILKFVTGPFSDGMAPLRTFTKGFRSGKTGYIDKTGREVILPKYSLANNFSEGLAAVLINDDANYNFKAKWGYIDKTGEVAIPFNYDETRQFRNGLAEVKLNKKRGVIDKTGKEVVPLKYDEIWCYGFWKEGFIGVILNGKKGFVDLEGHEYFNF